MNFKVLIASVLFLVCGSSFGVSNGVSTQLSFNEISNSYVGDFANFGPSVFAGGSDKYIFTLPPKSTVGTYHVTTSIAGSGLNIDWAKTTLNGVKGTPVLSGVGYDFGYITTNTKAPFILEIFGSKIGAFQAIGGHIDATITSPVDEPHSAMMFCAGLGIIGAVARRRKSS